ncbi:MAG: sulfatase [Rikenellaceae bacterium]|nr:sulfatase [Rikenellaceae bacterium]
MGKRECVLVAAGTAALIPVLPSRADIPAGAREEQGKETPNILFIMTDDHSYQTISAYGHPLSALVPTPNIDRLAGEGMLFRSAYVENSISTPSRATLLTGLYSHQHGQRTLDRGFDTTKTVFPELLRQAGYQTAVIGKWHLPAAPHGFDHYSILHDQGDYYNPELLTPASGGMFVRCEGYATDIITDQSLEWLEGRDPTRPFCLMVHHKAPHRNWMPDIQYLDLIDEYSEIPVPDTLFDDYSTRGPAARTQEMTIARDMSLGYDLKVDRLHDTEEVPDWLKLSWRNSIERMTPSQRAAWDAYYEPLNDRFIDQELSGDDLTLWKYGRYISDYLKVIKSIDVQVGRLLDWLDANHLTENTLVVYTSDQGFYMGEHGWYDKRFMYEESFRTPLLARWPAVILPSSVCDGLVQNIDFAPTFLDAAGVEIPGQMEGLPLTGLMSGEKSDLRDELYYQYYDYPAVHQVRKHYGIRTKEFKLIHFYGQAQWPGHEDIDSREFYDMSADPHEVDNRYGDPEYAPIISRLEERLAAIREKLGNPL